MCAFLMTLSLQRGADPVRYTPYQRYCNAVAKAFTTKYPLFELRKIYCDPSDPNRMLICSPFVVCAMHKDHPIVTDNQDKIDYAYSPIGLISCMRNNDQTAAITGKEDYNGKKDLITVLESADTGEIYRVNSRALKVFEPLDGLYGVRRKTGTMTIWDSSPGNNIIYGCIALIR